MRLQGGQIQAQRSQDRDCTGNISLLVAVVITEFFYSGDGIGGASAVKKHRKSRTEMHRPTTTVFQESSYFSTGREWLPVPSTVPLAPDIGFNSYDT